MQRGIQGAVHPVQNAIKNSARAQGEQWYTGLENVRHNLEQVVRGSKKNVLKMKMQLQIIQLYT